MIGGSDAFAPPRRLLSRPRYDYRAGSVEGDNTKLRRVGELGLLLILLRNIKGAFVPIFPVFVIDDDLQRRQLVVRSTRHCASSPAASD